MNIWQPEPGETLLSRSPVAFATGAAMRVRGMRWFRDTERNDIQGELVNWPDGPVYSPRSRSDAAGRNIVKGAAIAVGTAVMAALSSAGGNVSGSPFEDAGSNTPEEPSDEVEDFPVMWAAPGTVARTLPWQLDPGRSDEKHYRTHAIVTDRRLVIVGLPHDEKNDKVIDDQFLWDSPRSVIHSVEPRNYKDGTDFKIAFTDGSWCRLSSIRRRRTLRYLTQPLDLVPLESLTLEQRRSVSHFLAGAHAKDIAEPVISRRSSGHLSVEALVPSELSSFFGWGSRSLIMDSEGIEVQPKDIHPEDL